MLESKKMHFTAVKVMMQSYMPAYRSFHSLLLYQGYMVPDSTEEGTFGFANVKHLALRYHDVYNAAGLACYRKIRFEKTTIGKHSASCSIDESTELTFVTGLLPFLSSPCISVGVS